MPHRRMDSEAGDVPLITGLRPWRSGILPSFFEVEVEVEVLLDAPLATETSSDILLGPALTVLTVLAVLTEVKEVMQRLIQRGK